MSNRKCIQVACNVQNCYYWQQGNLCSADNIQVSNIDYGADMEAGSFNQPALSCNSCETQCITFKPR